MNKLSSDQVKKVARLAKLELNDKEVEKLGQQLSETITYIDKLNEIDTANIEPTSQVTGLTDVFRKDEIKPSLKLEDILPQAANTYHDYFKVKLILHKND